MPRSGRLQTFIKEYKESPKFEKLSFIPPFIILILEIILLAHAIIEDAVFVMILTTFLLVISIIEIVFVTGEIHEHYQQENFERIMTIKLDDYIIQKKEKNVKKIMTDFLNQHPEFEKYRHKIYHITCQILETHREEEWSGILTEKIKKFVIKNKDMNVEDLLIDFIKKYPSYKKYRDIIYAKICQIKVDCID